MTTLDPRLDLAKGTDAAYLIRKCEHGVIQTLRYSEGEPDVRSVALWPCASCRLRFARAIEEARR